VLVLSLLPVERVTSFVQPIFLGGSFNEPAGDADMPTVMDEALPQDVCLESAKESCLISRGPFIIHIIYFYYYINIYPAESR